jgi:NAD(P)-dependent dehydrogenase (short-subunit alcohol dehydrogenase family)
MSLSGSTASRRVLITGAASGIGLAMAHQFNDAGAAVVICDRDAEAAEAARLQLGSKAAVAMLDVADVDACHAVAATVWAQGRIDVLINNAGIGSAGNGFTTTANDLDQMWRVNVAGVFHLTHAFLPPMIEAGGGCIINTASVGGLRGIRDRLAYCTTKHAVVGMTRCIALDHAADGIRCNCLCPGRVKTPWIERRLLESDDPDKTLAEMSATQPHGRMVEPSEVAAAAVFLASDAAASLNGVALPIDGGWTAA